MRNFIISHNDFLRRDVAGFFGTDYLGYRKAGNPDYIVTLKNTGGREYPHALKNAARTLYSLAYKDVAALVANLGIDAVCVMPRAKANYGINMLFFKLTISKIVDNIGAGVQNGVECIRRVKNTRTTHFKHFNPLNDGDLPYPGITLDTCEIKGVAGKNILLIDDVYTRGVNVDEDCIEALYERGAKSVAFYAAAKTLYRKEREIASVAELVALGL